mmetsp:Transcript_1509/g.2605  ORF Transcript_1509/g.2605 Transcript_1509/m.2605 type:complete len:510 (+) Transcript_1509:393-1922(+)
MWNNLEKFFRKKQKPAKASTSLNVPTEEAREARRSVKKETAEEGSKKTLRAALRDADAKETQRQIQWVEYAESAIPLQSRPEVTDDERKKGETQLMEQLQKLSAAEAPHPTDRRKFAYISKSLSQISCNDCARDVLKSFSDDLTRMPSTSADPKSSQTSPKATGVEVFNSHPRPIPKAMSPGRSPHDHASNIVKRVEFSSSESKNKFMVSMLPIDLDDSAGSSSSYALSPSRAFNEPIGSVRSWLLRGDHLAADVAVNTKRPSDDDLDIPFEYNNRMETSNGSDQSFGDANERNGKLVSLARSGSAITLRRSSNPASASNNSLNKVVVVGMCQALEKCGSREILGLKGSEESESSLEGQSSSDSQREVLGFVSWTRLYCLFTTDCCHGPGWSMSSAGSIGWQQRSAPSKGSPDLVDPTLRNPKDMEFKATQKKVTVRRDGTLTSVPIILGKTGTHHMFLDQQRKATWQAPLIRADMPIRSDRKQDTDQTHWKHQNDDMDRLSRLRGIFD